MDLLSFLSLSTLTILTRLLRIQILLDHILSNITFNPNHSDRQTGIETEPGADKSCPQPDANGVKVTAAVAVYSIATSLGRGRASSQAFDGIGKVPKES